jgi:hypothetical protein
MYRNQDVEAQTGVEPVHSGFADCRVSPSPLRLSGIELIRHLIILLSIDIVNTKLDTHMLPSLFSGQDNILRSPFV